MFPSGDGALHRRCGYMVNIWCIFICIDPLAVLRDTRTKKKV